MNPSTLSPEAMFLATQLCHVPQTHNMQFSYVIYDLYMRCNCLRQVFQFWLWLKAGVHGWAAQEVTWPHRLPHTPFMIGWSCFLFITIHMPGNTGWRHLKNYLEKYSPQRKLTVRVSDSRKDGICLNSFLDKLKNWTQTWMSSMIRTCPLDILYKTRKCHH